MCFSAGASFGASALLVVVGVAAIAKARTTPQRMFAAIGLVFAVQQFAEGMLWLSLKNTGSEASKSFFTYAYLFFAMIIWPVWIPLTICLLEKKTRTKKIMNLLLGIGIVTSIVIGCILLFYEAKVVATHHHLHYTFGFSPTVKSLVWIFSLLYFVSTIVPPFISGIKRMRWLGIVFAISYLFAVIFYSGFVVSVWCYFAAILSIVVLWIVTGLQKRMY